MTPAPVRSPRQGSGEEGRVTAFVVVLTSALLLFTGLVLDGGNALAAKTRAIGLAQQAARAGAQQIDLAEYRATGTVRLLPDQAGAAAHSYLAAAGATGTVTVADDQISVTVQLTQPTLLLHVTGIRTITVEGTGAARARHGVSAPEP